MFDWDETIADYYNRHSNINPNIPISVLSVGELPGWRIEKHRCGLSLIPPQVAGAMDLELVDDSKFTFNQIIPDSAERG